MSRKPPAPAPNSLPPLAPASRACRYHSSTCVSLRPATERSLELPVAVEQRPDALDIAPAERLAHLVGEIAHPEQRRGGAALDDRLTLSAEHVGGRALTPSVEEHERAVKTLQCLRGTDDRLDSDASLAGHELDEVEASMRRRVLVLAADRLSQDVDLDVRRLLGQISGRSKYALVCIQRVQQPNRHGAGGAQSSALRRHIRQCHQVQAPGKARQAQSLPHQLVLDLAGGGDDLGSRVADPQVALEAGGNDDMDPLVDRSGDDSAAVLVTEVGKIGAPSDKRHAQGRLGDDHARRSIVAISRQR